MPFCQKIGKVFILLIYILDLFKKSVHYILNPYPCTMPIAIVEFAKIRSFVGNEENDSCFHVALKQAASSARLVQSLDEKWRKSWALSLKEIMCQISLVSGVYSDGSDEVMDFVSYKVVKTNQAEIKKMLRRRYLKAAANQNREHF